MNIIKVSKELPKEYADENIDAVQLRSLQWSSDIRGMDFLIALVGNRLVVPVQSFDDRLFLKILDEKPKLLVPPLKSIPETVICMNEPFGGCNRPNGIIEIDPNIKELDRYVIGDRLKIKEGKERDVFMYFPVLPPWKTCAVVGFTNKGSIAVCFAEDVYAHDQKELMDSCYEKI